MTRTDAEIDQAAIAHNMQAELATISTPDLGAVARSFGVLAAWPPRSTTSEKRPPSGSPIRV